MTRTPCHRCGSFVEQGDEILTIQRHVCSGGDLYHTEERVSFCSLSCLARLVTEAASADSRELHRVLSEVEDLHSIEYNSD